MEKRINMNENQKLSGDMEKCSVLLGIAMCDPNLDKFTVAAMRLAGSFLKRGAVKLRDTTDASIALIKVVESMIQENDD